MLFSIMILVCAEDIWFVVQDILEIELNILIKIIFLECIFLLEKWLIIAIYKDNIAKEFSNNLSIHKE